MSKTFKYTIVLWFLFINVSFANVIDIDNTQFEIINKKSKEADYYKVLELILEGNDVGVMSESGCPGIADPGQRLCAICHENKIITKPLIGPSSILLGLMASGLNGQKFQFHGYLPIEKNERITAIKKLKENFSKNPSKAVAYLETGEKPVNRKTGVINTAALASVISGLMNTAEAISIN